MSFALIAENGYVLPLKSMGCKANITDYFGIFKITQQYRNENATSVIAKYVFQPPHDGIVMSFSACTGNKKITSSLIAIQNISKSAYTNSTDRDTFEARIGKILSGNLIDIEITYIQRITSYSDKKRIIIPVGIHPQVSEAEQVAIDELLEGKKYRLSIDLVYEGTDMVGQIHSPSHRIKIEFYENKARILFSEEMIDSNEIIIDIYTVLPKVPIMLSNEDIALYSFTPDFDKVVHTEKEYLFVIDLSCFNERKLEQLKNAILICIRGLSNGDRFNVMVLSDVVYEYSGSFQPADDIAFNELETWFADLKAKEIESIAFPASDICKNGNDRMVILLSDGAFKNNPQVIEYIREMKAPVFYTFAVSQEADEVFLHTLSYETGGKFKIFTPCERYDEALIRGFSYIASACIENAVIIIDNSFGTIYPKFIRRIHQNEHLSVMAQLHKKISSLILVGEVNGKRITWEMKFENRQGNYELLRTMFAKRKIDEFSKKTTYMKERVNAREIREMTSLSFESGILSSKTAFLLTYCGGYTAFSDFAKVGTLAIFAEEWPELKYELEANSNYAHYINLAKQQKYDGSFLNAAVDVSKSTSLVLTEFCKNCINAEIFALQLKKAVKYLLKNIEENEKTAIISKEVINALDNWHSRFGKTDEISQKVLALVYLHKAK